jgi:hypothetical protein
MEIYESEGTLVHMQEIKYPLHLCAAPHCTFAFSKSDSWIRFLGLYWSDIKLRRSLLPVARKRRSRTQVKCPRQVGRHRACGNSKQPARRHISTCFLLNANSLYSLIKAMETRKASQEQQVPTEAQRFLCIAAPRNWVKTSSNAATEIGVVIQLFLL